MDDKTLTLDRIITTIGELPASPAVVGAVMSLTSDLNSTINDISRVLSADQSLTAKVLRLSNSSFYGRTKEVGTLAEAIIILGFFSVRSLVIASSAHSLYCRSEGIGRDYSQQLWQHSLSTGLAARHIAKRTDKSDAEVAFIAGLLHDIGKLVLMQKLGDTYHAIITEVASGNTTFHEAEKRQLGFTHAEVGRVLMDKWDFPPRLTQAIYRHHHNLTRNDEPITIVVQLANCVAKNLDVGFDEAEAGEPARHPAFSLLRLKPTDADSILNDVGEQFAAEVRLFEEA